MNTNLKSLELSAHLGLPVHFYLHRIILNPLPHNPNLLSLSNPNSLSFFSPNPPIYLLLPLTSLVCNSNTLKYKNHIFILKVVRTCNVSSYCVLYILIIINPLNFRFYTPRWKANVNSPHTNQSVRVYISYNYKNTLCAPFIYVPGYINSRKTTQ